MEFGVHVSPNQLACFPNSVEANSDTFTVVYNEPYTQLIGQKHPALQGQDPKVGFVEVWDHFENLLSRQRENGETSIQANAFFVAAQTWVSGGDLFQLEVCADYWAGWLGCRVSCYGG